MLIIYVIFFLLVPILVLAFYDNQWKMTDSVTRPHCLEWSQL